ncbi:MAG TPA: haloacid dehalogenase type II [Chitinophagaceae bacterium]|jgi:2-haloacid dehalogenase|nr:haloacid dehalogenase type II [Chitinophagaceae bacterium]
MEQPGKPQVILLDVYDTLLDMSDVERRVNNLLDSKRGFRIWFELMMQYCFVENCTGRYHDFTAIGKATLKMAGKILGEAVSEDRIDDLLHLMRQLPLQEDAHDGLSALYDQGFRLAALTNAPRDVLNERMERTGLVSYFEAVLSGEEIKKYKPDKAVYQWAARNLRVAPEECLLVTVHSWDLMGALSAGMQAAFLNRPGQLLYPLAPEPHYTAGSLGELAELLEKAPLPTESPSP